MCPGGIRERRYVQDPGCWRVLRGSELVMESKRVDGEKAPKPPNVASLVVFHPRITTLHLDCCPTISSLPPTNCVASLITSPYSHVRFKL